MESRAFLVLALSLLASGCRGGAREGGPPRVARAEIEARSGSKLAGEATFTEAGREMAVVVAVRGAPPGLHAVHLHERGDCSSADALSAGSIFNPDRVPLAVLGSPVRHAGDLGDLEVGPEGEGRLEMRTRELTVAEGSHSVVGRSIIVHEREDDPSRPALDAGARIGCGVIRRVTP